MTKQWNWFLYYDYLTLLEKIWNLNCLSLSTYQPVNFSTIDLSTYQLSITLLHFLNQRLQIIQMPAELPLNYKGAYKIL